jgi:uncharacterized protein (TIGR03083 family)
VTQPDLLATTGTDGRELLTVAEQNWSRPIPHCPDWDAAQLVAHMGGILAWMATVITTGERVSRRDREQPPVDRGALAGWYSGHLKRTIDILTDADPDTETWTFSSRGDRSVGWWRRRLAVELAIHRWDAQHAASLAGAPAPRSLDKRVAAAGIEEFLIEFLPGLLAQDPEVAPTGTLHLHAIDGACEWWLDLDGRAETIAVARHAMADTAIRATCSDLLLWLTNRDPSTPPEVLGRGELLQQWAQLRR